MFKNLANGIAQIAVVAGATALNYAIVNTVFRVNDITEAETENESRVRFIVNVAAGIAISHSLNKAIIPVCKHVPVNTKSKFVNLMFYQPNR